MCVVFKSLRYSSSDLKKTFVQKFDDRTLRYNGSKDDFPSV